MSRLDADKNGSYTVYVLGTMEETNVSVGVGGDFQPNFGTSSSSSLGEQEQRRLQGIAITYSADVMKRVTLQKWQAKLHQVEVR